MTSPALTAPEPNLFIIGFPKSGTTSLSQVLRTDKRIFVCYPKELYFYCDDIYQDADIQIRDEGDYLQRFSAARPSHQYICDATILYVYSPKALATLPARYPGAKFIIIKRDPADFLPSWHKQLIAAGIQKVDDINEAWRRSDLYQSPLDRILNYKELCRQDKYIALWRNRVRDHDSLLVLDYELIKDNYDGFFEQVYAFLRLSMPAEVPHVHMDPATKVQRFPLLTGFLQRFILREPFLSRLKVYLEDHPRNVLWRVKKILFYSPSSQTLSAATKLELSTIASDDIPSAPSTG